METTKTEVYGVPYRAPFCPDVIRVHLLIGWPAGDILKQFPQMLYQKFWGYFFLSFLSRVLGSAVLPTQVNLFFQRLDSMHQPMGGHAHTGHTFFIQKIDFVDQSYHLRGFKRSRLFAPRPMEFGESADKGGEAGFVVFVTEPCPVPSPEKRF
jgi:hypothetical protein